MQKKNTIVGGNENNYNKNKFRLIKEPVISKNRNGDYFKYIHMNKNPDLSRKKLKVCTYDGRQINFLPNNDGFTNYMTQIELEA